MERVEILGGSKEAAPPQSQNQVPFSTENVDVSLGSFAGCGVLTLKRNVHGYKKLSLVTREELSRSELSLPDMEFDTFGFWLDCDAAEIGRCMTAQNFGYGVHALSHAICNVAPLFVPCVLNDVQCDHSFYNPTRVIIHDSRGKSCRVCFFHCLKLSHLTISLPKAGGSGICAQLWKFVFQPNGVIHAALDLLESCPSCSDDRGYVGGCPACIQAGECIKFNDFLCKRSAYVIGTHLLKRMEQTELYKANVIAAAAESEKRSAEHQQQTDNPDNEKGKRRTMSNLEVEESPRRKRRQRAMRAAKDIEGAQRRQTVVGRPGWPMDHHHHSSEGPVGRHQQQQEA